MCEATKTAALVAFSIADRDRLNAYDSAGLIPPEAWGDGTLLRILLEYLPQLIQIFMSIWNEKPPVPTPEPAPGPTT